MEICENYPPNQCAEFDYATPTGAAQLAARGLSLDAYALLRAGFRVLLGLVPITLGLLISLFLVTFGMAGEAVSVLAAAYPVFRLPAVMLDFIAAGIMMLLFFGLFPNGRMAPRRYWVVVAYFGIGYFVQATLGLVDIASPLGTLWSWTGWVSVLQIDRRFFRKKYDAQRVLARFAQTARDETDLDALTGELARVVQETLQPEHVIMWLRKQ